MKTLVNLMENDKTFARIFHASSYKILIFKNQQFIKVNISITVNYYMFISVLNYSNYFITVYYNYGFIFNNDAYNDFLGIFRMTI